ncbi:MAG: MFS transporter [Alphaproteobacteria bacterium]
MTAADKPRAFDALRRASANANFRLYAVGMWTTSVGVWVQTIGIAWLTWELTESTAWLGAIALAEAVPALALALWAGAIVDRVDCYKLMRVTQACQVSYALIIAVLSLAGWIDIWLLFGLTCLRGAALAFNRPARMTMLYAVVGRDLLPSALAVQSILFNSSRFLGPALGGAIIAFGGTMWAFIVAAAMYLTFTLLLSLMKVQGAPIERARGSVLAEMADGARYIAAHPGISLYLALLFAVSLCAKPLTDMLPGFADRVFALGVDGLAILMTAHGLGAMAGALWLAARSAGIAGMTSISIANALAIALSLMLFVATDSLWLACPMAAVAGFGFIVQSIAGQTLVQAAVDPALRGRVLSVYGVVLEGVPAIGAFLVGLAAEAVGLRWPLFAGAGLCLAAWFWTWRRRARLIAALETPPAAS